MTTKYRHLERALRAEHEMRDPLALAHRRLQRRTFLRGGGYGLGSLALTDLLLRAGRAEASAPAPSPAHKGRAPWPAQPGLPHHRPRVRRIIHLCMAGGPSQFESFDHKPDLARIDGQPFPESYTRGQQLAQLQGHKLLAMGPQFPFRRFGQSGQEICELFPRLGAIADKLCIVRSLHTEQINHDTAHAFFNTGSIIKGRPSIGSWLLWGLGAQTEDLPGFVVLVSIGRDGEQPISSRQWSAGCLPSRYQGIQLQSKGDAVHYVGSPPGVNAEAQARVAGNVRALDALAAAAQQDPEIDTRIGQYELAFRMQTSVPELTDLSREPEHVRKLYGVERPGDGSFASNCLLARRLAERGVRYIQLYHRSWDHHAQLRKEIQVSARQTDQATAALITDLEQRGMLEDTLVLWGGEFGRTPMGQGDGRDHHIQAFSSFLAGGGVRGGLTWGSTDELGYAHIKDGQEVAVRDLHATMLHLCGIDHERLTFQFQGLDLRLTGVEPARVVGGILAPAVT